MKCNKCGYEIESNDMKFCNMCGEPMVNKSKSNKNIAIAGTAILSLCVAYMGYTFLTKDTSETVSLERETSENTQVENENIKDEAINKDENINKDEAINNSESLESIKSMFNKQDDEDTAKTSDYLYSVLQKDLPAKGEEIAVIQTSYGDIKLRLYPEQAPLAVENFKSLINTGYYDEIIFHRVIDNFMIQGGDPTGTGSGGKSYSGHKFEDEISPELYFFKGALAMANTGPNTNGSQFFIVQNPDVNNDAIETIQYKIQEDPDFKVVYRNGEEMLLKDIFNEEVLEYYEEVGGHIELEYVFGAAHTIFGQAFEGLDVVDKIAKVQTDNSDKPLTPVIMEKVYLTKY